MMDNHSEGQFAGASRYVLDEELAKIVNISMALEMPLLLKGEPGTGKTLLALAAGLSLVLDQNRFREINDAVDHVTVGLDEAETLDPAVLDRLEDLIQRRRQGA